MKDYSQFKAFSPTTYADVLNRDQVMNISIRPLWGSMPRIAGPAYTVNCSSNNNLMLHAAIYRAPPGSVIVVESADLDYAVAGGNVCAVAQKRGIAAFVIDGVIRDLEEIRQLQFPVFARGIIPIPGGKNFIENINQPVKCGGVQVTPGDVIVADEEGILVLPHSQLNTILQNASERAEKDSKQSLIEWENAHRKRIDQILKEKSYE